MLSSDNTIVLANLILAQTIQATGLISAISMIIQSDLAGKRTNQWLILLALGIIMSCKCLLG